MNHILTLIMTHAPKFCQENSTQEERQYVIMVAIIRSNQPELEALAELRGHDQWVVWRLVTKQGEEKQTKVPFDANTGKGAKANDITTWASYAQARSAYGDGKWYTGVGYEFLRSRRITGIDLDHCVNSDGTLTPFAQETVANLKSYAEYSPSGTGLHIFVRGVIPSILAPTVIDPAFQDQKIEMYDHGHFFTVTGRHFAGTPTIIEDAQVILLDLHTRFKKQPAKSLSSLRLVQQSSPLDLSDQELIEKMFASSMGNDIHALWNGSHGIEDASKADYALCSHLAFWTGKDFARMERLFDQSVLGSRAKWQEREDYRRTTIDGAISACGSVYDPSRLAPVQAKQATQHVASDAETQGETKKQETTYEKLMEIAAKAHFIKTTVGELYARVPVGGHYEVVSLNEHGSGFRRWLVWQYKQAHGTVPNSDALSLAMSGIEADAEYTGEPAKIHVRKAAKDNKVYLDMGDADWRCIEITPDGWQIIDQPPVYFRRTAGMLPLPVPERGGSVDELRDIINASTQEDYMQIEAWLLGVLHPSGPYPALNLNGMRGSAKSSNTAKLRSIFDPNESPHRGTPKDEVEAAIAAENNMIVAFDNLSRLPIWLSDVICKFATGLGIAKRQLYTDKNEVVIKNKRPVIFNGIEDGIVTQEDLQSRTIQVMLCPPDHYLTEEKLEFQFMQKHPRILGAFLDAAVVALKNKDTVVLPCTPRMADFATWIVAAEPALRWEPGMFLEVYLRNQEKASSIVTESSPLAKAIMQLMEKYEKWEGMGSELLEELCKYEVLSKSSHCPAQPSQMSNQLSRLIASLRVQGIQVIKHQRTKKGSKFTLIRLPNFDPDDPEDPSGCRWGVGDLPKGVGDFEGPTPTMMPDVGLLDTYRGVGGVGGVGLLPHLSGSDSDKEKRKEREKEGELEGPDKLGKSPTPPTPPTPDVQSGATPVIAESKDTLETYGHNDYAPQHEVVPVLIEDRATWGTVATKIAQERRRDSVFKDGYTYGQFLDSIGAIVSQDTVAASSLSWARSELKAMLSA